MQIISVRMDDVRVGDLIYNKLYFAPDKWVKVTQVRQSGDIVSLYMGVSAHKTFDTRSMICGHAAEGIGIKRQNTCEIR